MAFCSGPSHSFLTIETANRSSLSVTKRDDFFCDVLHQVSLPLTGPTTPLDAIICPRDDYTAYIIICTLTEALVLDYESLSLLQHSTGFGCFLSGLWTSISASLPLKSRERVVGSSLLTSGAQLLATNSGRLLLVARPEIPALTVFQGPKRPGLFACGSSKADFREAQFARLENGVVVVFFDKGALVVAFDAGTNRSMKIAAIGNFEGRISACKHEIFCASPAGMSIFELQGGRLVESASVPDVIAVIGDRKFLVRGENCEFKLAEEDKIRKSEICVLGTGQVLHETGVEIVQLGVVRPVSLDFEISGNFVKFPEDTLPRVVPIWPHLRADKWIGNLRLKQVFPVLLQNRTSANWRQNLRDSYAEDFTEKIISFALSSQAPRHLLNAHVLWALARRARREVDVALAVAVDFVPGVVTAEARERLLSLDAVEDVLRGVLDRKSQADAVTAQSLLAFLVSKATSSTLSFAHLPFPRDHGFRSPPTSFDDFMGFDEILDEAACDDVLGPNSPLPLVPLQAPAAGSIEASTPPPALEPQPTLAAADPEPEPEPTPTSAPQPLPVVSETPVAAADGSTTVPEGALRSGKSLELATEYLSRASEAGLPTPARSTASLGLQSHASILVVESAEEIDQQDFSRLNLPELFAEGRRLLEQRRVLAASAAFGEGVDRLVKTRDASFLASFVLYRHVASVIHGSRGHSDPAGLWTLLLRFPITDGEILAVAKHAVSANFKVNRRRQAAAIADKILNSPLVELLSEFQRRQLLAVKKVGARARPVEGELKCPGCSEFLADVTQLSCLLCRARIAVDWSEMTLRRANELKTCTFCRATSSPLAPECAFCLN